MAYVSPLARCQASMTQTLALPHDRFFFRALERKPDSVYIAVALALCQSEELRKLQSGFHNLQVDRFNIARTRPFLAQIDFERVLERLKRYLMQEERPHAVKLIKDFQGRQQYWQALSIIVRNFLINLRGMASFKQILYDISLQPTEILLQRIQQCLSVVFWRKDKKWDQSRALIVLQETRLLLVYMQSEKVVSQLNQEDDLQQLKLQSLKLLLRRRQINIQQLSSCIICKKSCQKKAQICKTCVNSSLSMRSFQKPQPFHTESSSSHQLNYYRKKHPFQHKLFFHKQKSRQVLKPIAYQYVQCATCANRMRGGPGLLYCSTKCQVKGMKRLIAEASQRQEGVEKEKIMDQIKIHLHQKLSAGSH